jgi:hypothetical protein
MTTVAILEGCALNATNDVDLLGWSISSIGRSISRGVKKVTRPITRPIRTVTRPITRPVRRIVNKATSPVRKLVRPITRPMDRILKKTPIVRSVYRAGIAGTYMATGQIHKVPGAIVRTGKSVVKDFAGAKKFIIKVATAIVTPMAKRGVSKTVAKITAIPLVSAKASASFGPWSLPLVAAGVNEAINIVWSKIKSTASRVASRAISAMPTSLRKIARGFTPKIPIIPSVPPTPNVNLSQFPGYGTPPPVEQPKPAGAGMALLALPAIALLMG